MHDICYSLIRSGFKKIFLINGHNPNLILMQAVAYDLIDKYQHLDISIAAGTYIFMASEKCDAIGENFKDGTHKVYLVEGIEENSTYKSGDNFILEIKDDDSIILNFQDIESYRFIRKWGNDDKIKLH